MAHGAPDYSNVSKEGLTYRIDDLGELAVRLGSPLTYDRRGDVLWIDNFEGGLSGWTAITQGSGSEVNLSIAYRENGNFSCQLKADNSAIAVATIKRYQALIKNPKLGFNVAFLADNNVISFNILIAFYDGTDKRYIQLIFDYEDNELRISIDGGQIILDDDISALRGNEFFNHIKIAVDGENYNYLYAGINENEYDLSQYDFLSSSSSSEPHIEISLSSIQNSDPESNVYVDSFILTTNEE